MSDTDSLNEYIQNLTLSQDSELYGVAKGNTERLRKLSDQLQSFRNAYRGSLPHLLYQMDKDLLCVRSHVGREDYVPGYAANSTKHVAIDCEMVGVGYRGMNSALARVSIVNRWGHTLLDIYVQPNEKITNFRTRWSGISRKVLEQARREGILFSFREARNLVLRTIKGKILVGHSIMNDLNALEMTRPESLTVDTQMVSVYPYFELPRQPGLRRALEELFGISIQNSKAGHCSVEDAQASMLLYRVFYPWLKDH